MPERIVIDNFIDPKDAEDLIGFIQKNEHLVGDGRTFHADKTINWINISDNKIRDLLKYYARKTIIFIDHHLHTKTTMYKNMRLARWLKGMSMEPHIDKQPEYEDTMDYSALAYLNDAYEGGELFFVDENGGEEVYRMRAFSCIFFKSGKENSHGVKEILNGRRYTIPSFYNEKKKI
mgnify:CR=1 FL=1